jgi:hypothetical protein
MSSEANLTYMYEIALRGGKLMLHQQEHPVTNKSSVLAEYCTQLVSGEESAFLNRVYEIWTSAIETASEMNDSQYVDAFWKALFKINQQVGFFFLFTYFPNMTEDRVANILRLVSKTPKMNNPFE